MPLETDFGQPQDLWHTTESPLEQATLGRKQQDLRSKSAVFTSDRAGADPLCGLVSSKSRWLMSALSWPIAPVR